MIKEYFTDGLIGLAILLSLFRTDLVGIHNLINYPEVQDIILGQTAAYLPANFHHIHNNQHAFGNPKHMDFDNQAFNAWYQNINNLPLFRERRQNEIEAFLVSGTQNNIVGEQFQHDLTTNAISETDIGPPVSSPTLPVESANSFTVDEGGSNSSTSATEQSNTTAIDAATGVIDQTVVVDVSFLFNNPFPGCNLTKEDLELIDVLWRQDVDLGVGKEVFDHSLREELERERELELSKQQERLKSQLLAKEKEEREKQEQAERYLRENFRRDGETGEWVPLQNETGLNNTSLASLPVADSNGNNEFLSLEAALDFLSANVDTRMLQNLNTSQERDSLSGFSSSSVQELQGQQYGTVPQQQQQVQQQQQQLPYLERPDSLEESWNGLVDYLNMAASSEYENSSISSPSQAEQMNTSLTMTSDLGLGQDVDLQTDYLIQNATLPSPGMDLANDFNTLTPINEMNSSMPIASANMNSSMDFDLGDLNFFGDLTPMQNTTVDEIDLSEVDDLFRTIQGTNGADVMDSSLNLADNMDAIQMLGDSFSSSAVSMGSASPHDDFNEVYDGLEGATGGSDYNSNHGDMSERFSKVSRLSESSNDSGIGYQGGFSSSSSSSSSSYAGSPAGSQNGINGSTSSNDTEHDPSGTRAVAQHHVAHNHTYNTPPGQVPREVKKYAQKEPSRKGPQSRDQRRAEELKVPFTIDEIIESPVETFNEMLTAHKLNEAQITLIRDIRRRGKNKVAAQNCRKRKVNVIVGLSDEMSELQKLRDRLVAERATMERETRKMKEKFGHLYTHIFQSLRDERGEPYDPNLFSLQQSSDGNVFLVPRNISVNNQNGASSSASSSPSSSKDSSGSKKRKSVDQ